MSFISDTQPHCRWCAKAIAKRTETIWFGRAESRDPAHFRGEKPKSRAEAQKLVNQQIVSLRWSFKWDGNYETQEREHIGQITVWDGETYDAEFFCSQSCAASLGRSMAAQGWASTMYNTKMKEG